MGKIKSAISKTLRSKVGKTALAVGGASALGLGAIALSKRLSRGKRGVTAGYPRRAGSLARLRSRVQRLAYKIKEKQLKRKLFKEEMRI